MQRRNTNQRKIVYDAIEILGHTTTEDLINYLEKNNNEDISLATVYRNLNILLEENKIKRIKLDNVDVYEVTKNKHYHFRCVECGAIYDFPLKGAVVSFNKNLLPGVNVRGLDIVLYGLCNNCGNKKES